MGSGESRQARRGREASLRVEASRVFLRFGFADMRAARGKAAATGDVPVLRPEGEGQGHRLPALWPRPASGRGDGRGGAVPGAARAAGCVLPGGLVPVPRRGPRGGPSSPFCHPRRPRHAGRAAGRMAGPHFRRRSRCGSGEGHRIDACLHGRSRPGAPDGQLRGRILTGYPVFRGRRSCHGEGGGCGKSPS